MSYAWSVFEIGEEEGDGFCACVVLEWKPPLYILIIEEPATMVSWAEGSFNYWKRARILNAIAICVQNI